MFLNANECFTNEQKVKANIYTLEYSFLVKHIKDTFEIRPVNTISRISKIAPATSPRLLTTLQITLIIKKSTHFHLLTPLQSTRFKQNVHPPP